MIEEKPVSLYAKDFNKRMEPLLFWNLIVVSDEHAPRMRKSGRSESREERLVEAIRRLIVEQVDYWIDRMQEIERCSLDFQGKIVEFVGLVDRDYANHNVLSLEEQEIFALQDLLSGISLDDIFALFALELFNPWPEETK